MQTLIATAPSTGIEVVDVPRAAGGGRTRRRCFALEARDHAETLERVLNVLRRRCCRVTEVDFVAPDRHHPGRMVVTVEAPQAHAHLVQHWLAGVVTVLSVEPVGA